MDRWTKILESKPIPILEHLAEELSKLLAKDLESWPPPVEELDPVTGRTYAPLFEPGYPRPAPAVYREAFHLARLELGREVEAHAEYLRNRRWAEVGLSETDKVAMLFLSYWLTEQLFAIGEATEGRVKRKDLIAILARIEKRAVPSPIALA